MVTPGDDSRTRARLARIARAEAEREPAGDANLAGPEIEKFLVLFRETMNRRANTRRYSDLSVGYAWCGAFAYYCCLRAGFEFPPEPSERVNGSLAAVSTWYEWASLTGSGMIVSRGARPEVGDIVLFDRLLEDVPLDHLGIVIGIEGSAVRTAEGNVENRAGIFHRELDDHVRCFVRLRGGETGAGP